MGGSVISCERCDAPIAPSAQVCRYCGAPLATPAQTTSEPVAAPESAPVPPSLTQAQLDGADFGLSHRPTLHLLAAFNVVIVGIGWALENPDTYWSSDAACATWLAGPLIWSGLVATLWRGHVRHITALIAVWPAGAFVCGLLIRGHRINNDALALSAAIAAPAALGFLIGRMVHASAVKARASR